MATEVKGIEGILSGEWAVITAAPLVFVVAVILVGFAIWAVIQWTYRGRVERRNSAIESKDATIELLRGQIKVRSKPFNKEPETRPYDEWWEKVDAFYLWQAAWLWVGQEPRPRLPDDSLAYPAFSMLKQAALAGNLELVAPGRTAKVDAWALVTKESLRRLAAVKSENPVFLLGPIWRQ